MIVIQSTLPRTSFALRCLRCCLPACLLVSLAPPIRSLLVTLRPASLTCSAATTHPFRVSTALHCTALHCTALHCTAPHRTALHRAVLQSSLAEVLWSADATYLRVCHATNQSRNHATTQRRNQSIKRLSVCLLTMWSTDSETQSCLLTHSSSVI
jgi:hypothetical protein